MKRLIINDKEVGNGHLKHALTNFRYACSHECLSTLYTYIVALICLNFNEYFLRSLCFYFNIICLLVFSLLIPLLWSYFCSSFLILDCLTTVFIYLHF